MGKARSGDNADLPTNLYRGSGDCFRYRRRDTGKHVGVGSNKQECIAAAIKANEILGVRPGQAQMGRDWHTQEARRYFIINRDRPTEILRTIFRDIIPEEKEKRLIVGWANEKSEGRKFTGNRYIKSLGLNRDKPPVWVGMIHRNAKKNARNRNIEFDLDVNDIIGLIERSRGRCEVSGVRLRLDEVTQKHVRRPWAPSLDRVDSFRGYSIENCRIVCVAANIAMGQWGEEVLVEMAKGIARRHTGSS